MLATEGVKVLESPDFVQNKILSTSSVQYNPYLRYDKLCQFLIPTFTLLITSIVHSHGHRLSPITQAIFDVSRNIGL